MSESAHLSVGVRHGFGIGALSIALANSSVMFFLLKFLLDGAGMSPATAGWVLLVAKVWDGVIDPFVGRMVDNTRTRWGSRRPWIAGATLPFALLFSALWWDIPLTGWAQAGVYVLLIMGYSTAYSLISVPYGALTPALTSDYDERTKLNGARMGWSMVGGIVAGVLFPYLLHNYSWTVAGAVLGAAAIVPLLITLWSTQGRDPVMTPETDESPAMFSVLRVVPFRRTALLFLAGWSSITVLSSLVPFYVEHHLFNKSLLDYVFAVIQLSALVSIPGVVWLAQRVEKHVAYAICFGSWAAVMCAMAAVPPGSGTWVIGIAALTGPGVAAAHVLPWSMLPDVIEADRVEFGTDRTGSFYGLMTFLEQCGTAMALWMASQVLGVAGYIPEAVVQPDSAKLAIRLLIGPVPAVVLVLAAIGALVYPPLTREAHRALVARLNRSATS